MQLSVFLLVIRCVREGRIASRGGQRVPFPLLVAELGLCLVYDWVDWLADWVGLWHYLEQYFKIRYQYNPLGRHYQGHKKRDIVSKNPNETL